MKIISQYIKYCKTDVGKSIASNFGWLMLLQIVNYCLPLITLPYLAHVIGVTGFGKIAFASAVIMWFQTVSDWGFNFTATRDIARNKNNLNKISEIFSNVLFARIAITIIGFLILTALISIIPIFRNNAKVLVITFLLIPGHIICPDWFYQGMERMKFMTILNVTAKCIFTALVFTFIKTENDYILQPLFISLGYIVSGVISLYIIIAKWDVRIIFPKFKQIYATIISSTDVFINCFIPNLYNSLSIVLMGFWGGPVANGLYDAGSKFINVVIQFIYTLSRTFFPFLSREIRHHNKYALVNFVLVCICAILLYIGAPLLIKLFFTPEFYKGLVVTRILAISLPFLSLSNIYGTNYLILKGREKQLRNATLISSLVGFCVAIPLIYNLTYIGAAITVAFSRILLGIIVYFSAKKISQNKSLCEE
ncbi:MAG: oligosaccharide flippase family protein [Muribaculum sp.]|nr:oligosaccharide flippase family protein [Muribaculum sp.]